MKVSLVMPFRNVEAYISQALSSIVAQDYADWELLAVDDHSQDRSACVVSKWGESDPRIRLLTSEGRGIIPALKTAERHLKGSYVSRMDSDDVASPDRLRHMVDSLNAAGDGHVAVGLVRYFSHSGISDGYRKYESWLNGLTTSGRNFQEIYKECVIPSPCWMVMRNDFEDLGGFASDGYPEDYDLCFRMYRENLKILPVRRLLHWWRDYPDRTSRTSEWYAQNSFLDLKIRYFLELDRQEDRPLVLWGAGWKGKQIARQLSQKEYHFHWLCDNPRKWGKKIYGLPLSPVDQYDRLGPAQSIVAVANPEAQRQIRAFFGKRGLRPQDDFFFFC